MRIAVFYYSGVLSEYAKKSGCLGFRITDSAFKLCMLFDPVCTDECDTLGKVVVSNMVRISVIYNGSLQIVSSSQFEPFPFGLAITWSRSQ